VKGKVPVCSAAISIDSPESRDCHAPF
jgi:hypothetical protein